MPLPQNQLSIPVYDRPSLQAYTGAAKFSWGSELRHLFSPKFLNILWWPCFQFHQRWFTRSPFFVSCKKLPGFSELWNTIQMGAFAYNRLFLGLSAFSRQPTDLADITTLTLFFGDEFIDGLAETAGKTLVRELIKNNPHQFYLRKTIVDDEVMLYYQFDLRQLFPKEILSRINSKYQITYERFYELLQQLLAVMNQCLNRLPFERAQKAADKIADASNTCFKSFLHDVHGCCGQGELPEVETVLQFHETKTAYMQERLLELRCVLAGKEEMMQTVQIRGWLNIMRVIQIYDDIQDMVIDVGFQDNIVLSVAYHHFPNEWEWFCKSKNLLKKQHRQRMLLSGFMPCSMEYCMRLAREKMKTMNWEQQKIMHYLLFKSKYVLLEKRNDCLRENLLMQFYKQVQGKMTHLPCSTVKAFAIDTLMHVKESRKQIIKKAGFCTAYQLRYDLFLLAETGKAAVFDTQINS